MTVISLTGASGAGKSTLENALVGHFRGGKVAPTTTRGARSGETSKDFTFVSEADLLARRDAWVLPPFQVHGNWYAADELAFMRALNETSGRFAIVCVTPERHKVVRDYFAPLGIRTLAIHLLAPPEGDLRRRLSQRPWTPEELEYRIADSKDFDDRARAEGDIHFIEPRPQRAVFGEALRLYLSA